MHNMSGILITSGALQKPEMILQGQEMARGIKNTPEFSFQPPSLSNQKKKFTSVAGALLKSVFKKNDQIELS